MGVLALAMCGDPAGVFGPLMLCNEKACVDTLEQGAQSHHISSEVISTGKLYLLLPSTHSSGNIHMQSKLYKKEEKIRWVEEGW